MKKKIDTIVHLQVAAFLIGVVLVGVSAPTVGAVEGTTEPDTPVSSPTHTQPTSEPKTTDNRTSDLQRQQAAQEKKNRESQEKRIKSCAAKSQGINNALSKVSENRQQTFNRLTEVFDKIQAFVTNKQLTVKNYDLLVSRVNARKSAAEASINKMLAVNTLNCNATRSPKDQLSTFREKRQGSVDAIKEYRTALKRLINAVKTSLATDAKKTRGTE